VRPNKSKTQETKDAFTPGHDSETQQEGKGLLNQIGDAAVGAKDAVVNALGGGNAHAHNDAHAAPRQDL
jgi:hypothetical protein